MVGPGGIAAALALAALSALLAWASLPSPEMSSLFGRPFDVSLEIWPLVFVAFVPMVYAQHRVMPPRLAPLVPATTIVLFLVSQLTACLVQGEVPFLFHSWMFLLFAIIAGLGYVRRDFHAQTGYRWLALSFPTAWVGVDGMRVIWADENAAGTWGSPAYGLYEQPWLLQPLSVFGILGLELLILVSNFAFAHLVIAAVDRRTPPPHGLPKASWPGAVRTTATVGAIAIGWVVLSLVLWGGRDSGGAKLRVAAVTANTPLDPEEEYRRLVAGTRDLATTEKPQVVVWREGGLRFDPQVDRTEELRTLARETSTHIAIGYALRETGKPRRNEAVILTPAGTFHGPYGKAHPGEIANDFSDTRGSFEVYDTAVGKLATIICFDLDFTDSARMAAHRGAQFIAVPSMDPPCMARIHYTHLVYRAIENRVSVAKADGMSDAAIVDSYGRILERRLRPISGDEAKEASEKRSLPVETLVADVPLGTGPTIYSRLGDWVGWLCIAGSAAMMLAHLRARLRARRS